MPRVGLTEKQAHLLGFIEAEVGAGRPVPSFEEMAAFMGLRSKSNIHRLVTALEDRGRLVRLPHKARALALTSRAVPAIPARPEVGKPWEKPRLGIPKPVADQLLAYCDHRQLAPRDVLAAALRSYMEAHP